MTLGGTMTHLLVPDINGTLGDVVLGFDDVSSQYLGFIMLHNVPVLKIYIKIITHQHHWFSYD